MEPLMSRFIEGQDRSQSVLFPEQLEDWITDGCGCTTDAPKDYYSDTGVKFNSSSVKDAMDGRLNSILLFPVYDSTSGNGSNLTYHVIGFAGFYLTDYKFKGNGGTISGYFVKVDWNGQGAPGSTNYFGATNVRLVDPTS